MKVRVEILADSNNGEQVVSFCTFQYQPRIGDTVGFIQDRVTYFGEVVDVWHIAAGLVETVGTTRIWLRRVAK